MKNNPANNSSSIISNNALDKLQDDQKEGGEREENPEIKSFEALENEIKSLKGKLIETEQELNSQKSAYEALWEGHEQARSTIEKERDSN